MWTLPVALAWATVSVGRDETMWQKDFSVDGAKLYRLRLTVAASAKRQRSLAVLLTCAGEEGPAWPLKMIQVDAADKWQKVDVLFRPQVMFNPISKVTASVLSFGGQEGAKVKDVSFGPMPPGQACSVGVGRWLIVPTHRNIRYADVRLGLGVGLAAEEHGVRLFRDGKELGRVDHMDAVTSADEFAFSGRTRRLYVQASAAKGTYRLYFVPRIDKTGDGYLKLPPADGSAALKSGRPGTRRVPLEVPAGADTERKGWPITQGIAFPRGEVAHAREIRILNPDGREIPVQIRPTSFWEDDSFRWALLDFNVDQPAGRKATYVMECGAGVRRKARPEIPVRVVQAGEWITVNTGPMEFKVSSKKFRLLENVLVDGRKALPGPVAMQITPADGRILSTDAVEPYYISVEEAGPMRAVVAVRGFCGRDKRKTRLSYTTRIHAYAGRRFVKIDQTITNRGPKPFPVASQVVTAPLPKSGPWRWSLGGPALSGKVDAIGMTHLQSAEDKGTLVSASGRKATGGLGGMVSLTGRAHSVVAAVHNYAKLFPKGIRVSEDAAELDLLVFGAEKPDTLWMGVARSAQFLLAFGASEDGRARLTAKTFLDPPVLVNPPWYCSSKGFANDVLVPIEAGRFPLHDAMLGRGVDRFVEDKSQYGARHFFDGPQPKGLCVHEYDTDLGLYLFAARSGRRDALLRTYEATRAFLDGAMFWYTGAYGTHGHNRGHHSRKDEGSAPAAYNSPGGHTYSIGAIYYWLLSGDRRGLEGARSIADACYRNVHPRQERLAAAQLDPGPRASWGQVHPLATRGSSNPARFALAAYECTGERKYLETAVGIADNALRLPREWLATYGTAIHYRWPQNFAKLHALTGDERYKDILTWAARWTIQNPYAVYGEFRSPQSYSSILPPKRMNWDRMLFQTIFAYERTRERAYLDWTMNTFDEMVSDRRRSDGNGVIGAGGKQMNKPQRVMGLIAPHRAVALLAPPGRYWPGRLEVRFPERTVTEIQRGANEPAAPGRYVWQIIVANVGARPLKGTFRLGPLPPGVKAATEHPFELAVGREKPLGVPMDFTDEIASGRTIIPYVVETTDSKGSRSERHGFIAVHAFKPIPAGKYPRLLLHAPLDDAGPAKVAHGKAEPIASRASFVVGRHGKALSHKSGGISFEATDNILGEQGTFAIWLNPTRPKRHSPEVLVHGGGGLFLGFRYGLFFNGTLYEYPPGLFEKGWHHFAVTWDVHTFKVYVDGRKVALKRGTRGAPRPNPPIQNHKRLRLAMPSHRIELCGDGAGSAPDFDDLRIYSVPLREEEIRALYRE